MSLDRLIDFDKKALPKAAQTLADDAKAAGWEVEVKRNDDLRTFEVHMTRGNDSAYAVWGVKNVAAANSRLGFQTHTEEALRFDYATTYIHRTYGSPTSVRSLRGQMGLVI